MLEFILGDLSSLIAAHGLWIVALVIGVESMGLPLPGETCLVTASIYAGATGNLTLVSVLRSLLLRFTHRVTYGASRHHYAGTRYCRLHLVGDADA
jgi:hypothetical protein